VGELAGFRSLRVIGQRYRILYRVDRREVIVLIAAVGIRKAGEKADIYELAKKLGKQGLLR
jgi:mRNA interferase RelE/StbE